jgi:hypothetical protein
VTEISFIIFIGSHVDLVLRFSDSVSIRLPLEVDEHIYLGQQFFGAWIFQTMSGIENNLLWS